MEFRKMLMITLYAEQKKRHRCIDQSFRLCGRRRGWDVSREQHRNMSIIQGETDHSPGWMHETSARTWCTGKTQRDGVEREVGGGIGTGNTCKPMAVTFQCMTKSTTIKKIIIIKKKMLPDTNLPKIFVMVILLCVSLKDVYITYRNMVERWFIILQKLITNQ